MVPGMKTTRTGFQGKDLGNTGGEEGMESGYKENHIIVSDLE
jgi:hypothetical protein